MKLGVCHQIRRLLYLSAYHHGIKKYIEAGSHKGKGIAVFTSGGDSPGMNAAVRAVVRTGLYLGCKMFFIHEGYQGMVDGGSHIRPASWVSVSSIIHKGGTIIGSARCKEFREKPGRLKAAKNLITAGIQNLVVIGGDGSLTGANIFRQEWPALLDELLANGEIDAEQRKKFSHLNIVGMVGSIDNDFSGADMTIGANSALHRIMEAIDAIVSTASSHQRTFIMEVMGRHCGYLSLVSAVIVEADYIFIPEDPPVETWAEDLMEKLLKVRAEGRRLNIIVVAEGAQDRSGNPITSEMVRKVVVDNLKQDARITVLGHVQRGGNPSAFDRILGCRMGAEAVLAVVEATPDSEAMVITLEGNQAVRLPLMQCVQKTQDVSKAMANHEWEKAVELRGWSFYRNLETFKKLTRTKPPESALSNKEKFTFGVLHVGAPACGMNAAVRSFVKNCAFEGNQVLGILEGVEGLIDNKMKPLDWSSVNGWTGEGGAILGTKRTTPGSQIDKVAENLRKNNIDGLVLIGGFEAFRTGLEIAEGRKKYPELCIPLCIIPSTISNNVPGSDFSLGCDTSLNEITEICDRIRQSAQGTKRRVFIIETMGGYCGYLATLAGMAGGADAAYIFEEKFSIKDLEEDLFHMASKMEAGVARGLILRNEKSNENYTTDFVQRLYAEEGKGIFTARMNILGHLQQGGTPSPFDRNFGTKQGARAAEWILDQAKKAERKDGKVYTTKKESAAMMGLIHRTYAVTPLVDLIDKTDFEHQLPSHEWWIALRPQLKVLALHESGYKAHGAIVESKYYETPG